MTLRAKDPAPLVARPGLVEVGGPLLPLSLALFLSNHPGGLGSGSEFGGGRDLLEGSVDTGWPPPSTGGGHLGRSNVAARRGFGVAYLGENPSFGLCVLEGITEAKLPTPSATLHGKSKILESDDGDASTSFPLRASTLEVCIATRGQWIVSWRSGVVSCSSTTTCLDGVAQ
jgi:hypothetical protein